VSDSLLVQEQSFRFLIFLAFFLRQHYFCASDIASCAPVLHRRSQGVHWVLCTPGQIKKNFVGVIDRGKFKCVPRQSKSQIFEEFFLRCRRYGGWEWLI